jgi:hypothetical protein
VRLDKGLGHVANKGCAFGGFSWDHTSCRSKKDGHSDGDHGGLTTCVVRPKHESKPETGQLLTSFVLVHAATVCNREDHSYSP